MSEHINKLLCTLPQSFTTAEQKIGRDNIAAQASGNYVSASTFDNFSAHIESAKLDASASSMFQPSGNYQTAGDYAYNSSVSSKQDSSAMSAYVPYSAISADADSAITSINGSSVGKFTGCSANNNITGNGMPGSPLGLSSEVWITAYGASARLRYDQLGMYTETGHNYTEIDRGALHVLQRTGSLDYQAEYGHFYGTGMHYSHSNMSDVKLSANWEGLYIETANGVDSASARFDASSLQFKDGSGNLHVVDSASIDKWNAGSWNESANSIGTGFGGNHAVSASQYNCDAYSNWACREVYGDGIPAQLLYGFQSIPGTQGKYNINESGVFVPVDRPAFNLKVYKPTTANMYLTTADYPAMPATADGLLVLVNLGNGPAVVYPNTFGATANIAQNNSAQLIWDHEANAWVRLNN